MYKIINIQNNQVIGFTVEPRYIQIKPSTGVFIPTDKEHAQGVVYNSIPYNLVGKDGINAETTVFLEEFDITNLIINIPDLENAICELDAFYNERFIEIERRLEENEQNLG